MYTESDFNRKGCLLATWLLVIITVGQEICWIINGEWITAICVPLLMPLLIVIPWGILKLLTWDYDKSSMNKNEEHSNENNDRRRTI